MNREIKFRGISTITDDFVTGYLLSKNVIGTVTYKSSVYTVTNDVVEPETVGQYTGLNDKYGTEIYEGDIVNMHIFTQELGENLGVVEGEREMIVEISIGIHGVMVNNEPLAFYLNENWHDMSEPFEVLGNIYQNQDMLTCEN